MLVRQQDRTTADSPERGSGAETYFRLPARVLLTSTAMPPLAAGHAVVLDRMFRRIHPDDYRIVHFDEFMPSWNLKTGWSALPAKTLQFPNGWWMWDPSYRLSTVRRVRQFGNEVAKTASILARFCVKEKCEAIVVTTGSLPRMPAAVAAAKLARVPVILLIWDFWRYLEIEALHNAMAQMLEPVVLRGADAVVAPNEMLAESIARLDGVEPVIIRLPIDDDALQDPDVDPPSRSATHGFNIVFTGQIYPSMPDPYKRLLAALDEPGMEDVTFHVYGPQPKEWLEGMGLRGRFEQHPFVPAPAIYDIQRNADVLFLPLAFEGDHKNLVYSSSTTKLSDYLASGRPIIVHTPPGAYPAWYARRHECGMVVDSPDPKALARAITVLRSDLELTRRLGRNGMTRARTDYSSDVVRRQFADLIATVVGKTR